MSFTTFRPTVASATKCLTTHRRAFTPTNLISPPSINTSTPERRSRPPPRLILSPQAQLIGTLLVGANSKSEIIFANVRFKELLMDQFGGLGSRFGNGGQLRTLTNYVTKETIAEVVKKVVSDNELHDMRYKMCASKNSDFVKYDITAWRKYNGIARQPTQRKKLSTVASKEAWENELKIAEEMKVNDNWIAALWWFRAY